MVARGWGRANGASEFNGDRVSVGENETVLETDGSEGCTTVYLTQLNYMLKNGQMVNFVLYLILLFTIFIFHNKKLKKNFKKGWRV